MILCKMTHERTYMFISIAEAQWFVSVKNGIYDESYYEKRNAEPLNQSENMVQSSMGVK